MSTPSSLDNQPVEQPWKVWYTANKNMNCAVHYVVPVMAAGNQAPATQQNGRLDLSKPKSFGESDKNEDIEHH